MEHRSFEQLISERLVIRRFASRDAEAFASYRSDEEVARYQDWDCPYSISDARAFIANLQGVAPGTPGAWFQFAVSLASSGTLLGDVALRSSDSDVGEAELGFTFASPYQGQGFAAEAVRTVVQYAFGQLAMHRVFSRTDARNLRAQRLLERIGFRHDGELRARTWFKGTWASDVLYAQLETEWSLRWRDSSRH